MNLTVKKILPAKNNYFVEGLPGIGNVGKIAADYLIEQIKAEPIGTITSNRFPNLVIINEDNLVDLPVLKIYHKKIGASNIFIFAGDFQPPTEEGSYELTKLLLKFCDDQKVAEIISLGGIGLMEAPKKPEVYVTANNKKLLSEFKKYGVNPNIYGKVGTIIGVTGLLIGLAKKETKAVSLLVETSQNPGILGLQAAKELVSIINIHYKLKINMKNLDSEIKKINRDDEAQEVIHKKSVQSFQETNYIG